MNQLMTFISDALCVICVVLAVTFGLASWVASYSVEALQVVATLAAIGASALFIVARAFQKRREHFENAEDEKISSAYIDRDEDYVFDVPKTEPVTPVLDPLQRVFKDDDYDHLD